MAQLAPIFRAPGEQALLPSASDVTALGHLQKLTGAAAYRPLQEEAIDAVLLGKDAIVVLATGAGKSVCFQLPPLIKRQAALIICPTISLMKDQVAALSARGFSACFLGSASDMQTRSAAYAGQFQFVYITPEYASTRDAADLTTLHTACRFCLIALDEAHCIADMGKGFRSTSYSQLHRLRGDASPLRDVPWIAVTATATPAVRADIQATLQLRAPVVLTGSAERPNLHLSCRSKPSEDTAVGAGMIANMILGQPCSLAPAPTSLARFPGEIPATVIYCVSKAEVESLRTLLDSDQRLRGTVRSYSADKSAQERAATQEAFEVGTVRVLVATSAFGLGINKKDIRWIINWGPPGSLQMYFQMVGRGGRDMQPARCLLVWSRANVATKRFLQRQDAARSGATSMDAADFDSVMKFIEEPLGCRQAQIAGTFAGTAPRGNAALAALCQGGCDVCDLRFAALRDMGGPAKRVLLAVELDGALARAALIERCLAEAEADPALPRCAAFWLELTRTLAGLGLVAINAPPSTAGASATLSEAAAPPDDLVVITSAGQQELALLCSHAQPPGDGTASAAPGKSTEARAVTRNMRCSGPLLQAEAAAVASSSGAMDAIIANVAQGRTNLRELCDHLDILDSQHLPRGLRALLPCVHNLPRVVGLAADAVAQHKVDRHFWAAWGPLALRLAGGGVTWAAVAGSEEVAAAKRRWVASGAPTSTKMKSEEQLAAQAVQEKALVRNKGAAKLAVELRKAERKIVAAHRKATSGKDAAVDAELAGLSAAQLLPATLQQAVLDALPSDAEALAAVPGMPAAVAKHFGGIILDALTGQARAAPRPQQLAQRTPSQHCTAGDSKASQMGMPPHGGVPRIPEPPASAPRGGAATTCVIDLEPERNAHAEVAAEAACENASTNGREAQTAAGAAKPTAASRFAKRQKR